MEFRQCPDSIMPPENIMRRVVISSLTINLHLSPFPSSHARESRIFKNPPIKEFHNVERRSDHCSVLAQAVYFRYWHVCLP